MTPKRLTTALLLALCALVAQPMSVSGTVHAASADDGVLAADRAYFEAIASRPPTALEGLLEEAFVYRTSRGAAVGKRALIGHLSQGLTRVADIKSWRRTPAVSGDTAVVTGIAEVTVTEADGPRVVWSRYTHVWVSHAGRWRLLHREATESPGRPPREVLAPDLAP